jgi:hypothetical protein
VLINFDQSLLTSFEATLTAPSFNKAGEKELRDKVCNLEERVESGHSSTFSTLDFLFFFGCELSA